MIASRRVVVIDENEKSRALSDGPSPDIRTDPARPGFASARMWVTDRHPARLEGVRETLDAPQSLEPPPGGSVCRVVTFPPDAAWRGRVGEREVRAYFESMGSPAASTWSASAPHPYMQKTRALEYALVTSGKITLVLDTGEVELSAGEIVVLLGANHAWSNRSGEPCVVAFSSHDAYN